MLELGKTYRDKITGFVGIATGQASYLNDTPSVRLEGKVNTDGKVPSEWVHEARCEEVQGEAEAA